MGHQLRSSGVQQLKCSSPAMSRRYPAKKTVISMDSPRRIDGSEDEKLQLRRRAVLSADKQNVGAEVKNPDIEVPEKPEKAYYPKDPSSLRLLLQKIVEQNASIDLSKTLDIHNKSLTMEKEEEQQLEELATPVAAKQIEQMHQRMAFGSSFLSLLNGIGLIASGVLGALYATLQKEKSGMESTIQYLKAKLVEKETTAALLKEDYDAKLWNMQEEQHKQAEKEALLSGQLISANEMSTSLCKELQSKTRMLEGLKTQLGQLESGIAQTGEAKRMLELKLREKVDAVDALQHRVTLLILEINEKDTDIENLKLSIPQKESECKQLNSIINHAKADIVQIISTVRHLQEENLKIKEKLDSRNSSNEVLNAKIILYSEQERTSQKIHDPTKYDEMKNFSDSRMTLNLELPTKKDIELGKLQEKLRLSLREITRQHEITEELRKERDEVSIVLEQEVQIIIALKDELDSTLRKLEASRNENSRPSKVLEDAEMSIEELAWNVSQKQEFSEANESCTSSLRENNSTLKHLSEELAAVKGALKSTIYELGIASSGLKSVTEECESLKRELIEAYKKAESSAHELKEERVIVATLNKELEVVRKQLQKGTEARKALETDLDEVTKLLDEMNKSSLLLSREVEDANARTAFLGSEREILYKSLMEQKNLTKEAKENLENVQELITKLGGKRENLEQRCHKLKKELASAKGEIIRLRRAIDTRKESACENYGKPG